LVLDVQLPGMSGLDLQEHLNALAPGTPVVFITAYDDPLWRRRALAAGCAAFFDKGDAGREVLGAIHAAVNGCPRST
ncbi:response regulator, partial [Accumulibacter sp.]|uniref:response regulator n=1 Tax=Accumulibacter sp. TaxID=2053492 RepID=UPI0028C37D40